MKKILLILGHPARESLCESIAKEYENTCKKQKVEFKKIYIKNLKFDPVLHEGYNEKQKLEEDLQKTQDLIKWANHIVFIFPTWWGTYPSLLKGFIDRVFLPGFAFKYRKGSHFPERFLTNKTSTLIVTSGGPKFFYFFAGHPGIISLKSRTLKFCGFQSIKTILFANIHKNISKKRIDKIFLKTRKVAKRDCM